MISAAVVNKAMPMPTMPNRLPRIDVVGCDRPFSAWMKQTLATRYSSVTRFKLMAALPLAVKGERGNVKRAEMSWSFHLSLFTFHRRRRRPLLLLEHLEHAARDQEAAEDVDRGQGHGQHAHDLA